MHVLNQIFSRRPGAPSRRSEQTTSTPDTPLCSTCSALDITAIFRNERPIKNKVWPLGPLEDIIRKADHCRLCRLIHTLFRRRWCLDSFPDVDLSDVVCSLEPMGIGDPFLEDRKRCHQLYISSSRRPIEISDLMLKVDMDMALYVQLLEEDAHKVRRSRELHGRRVADTVDMTLLRKWLTLCEKEHGDACAHIWWISELPLPRSTRMVDVVLMSLIPAPADCRYIALSYVWGMAGDRYWTTTANVDSRSQPAGLDPSVLPATITDAIHVTRALGERYLWIDMLCIIQDSSDDKDEQICAMDLIYGRALLTIYATGGANVQAGLPGLSTGSRKPNQYIEDIHGLHLTIPFPSILEVIAQTVWNTRGWTFQEALISKRRLYFTNQQAYFGCAMDVWCEDLVAEGKKISIYPTRLRGSSAGSFMPKSPTYPNSDWISCYTRLVDRYTRRHLSYQSDVIPAITALTNVMARAYRLAGGDPAQAFRHGMLIKNLELSLLWQPRLDSDHTRRVSPETGLFAWPSWSWAGWVGAVRYNHAQLAAMVVSTRDIAEPSESLVGGWYLVDDNRRLIRLDVKRITFIRVLDEKRTPPARYMATVGDIDEATLGALPPPGTLVFRTQCAVFRVSKLEMSLKDAESAPPPHFIFGIVSDVRRPSTSVGRLILSLKTPSPSVFTFIVLARCYDTDGLYDEDVYGRYRGALLWVMAVRWVEDRAVWERVGLGVICEQAWLESNTKVETVFLG